MCHIVISFVNHCQLNRNSIGHWSRFRVEIEQRRRGTICWQERILSFLLTNVEADQRRIIGTKIQQEHRRRDTNNGEIDATIANVIDRGIQMIEFLRVDTDVVPIPERNRGWCVERVKDRVDYFDIVDYMTKSSSKALFATSFERKTHHFAFRRIRRWSFQETMLVNIKRRLGRMPFSTHNEKGR